MKKLAAALAIAGALLTASCAGMITGGPLIRPGEPTGTIQVVNGSRNTVTVVLISACSASTYGLNRLPSGVSIPPGRYYNFTVSAGCWDVDAGYGTGTGYAEARQRMQVRAGGGVRYTVTN
ncbi:MAG: hypothetical protein R3C16_07395 [Hyphomonadaceae bacterium]